MARKPPEEHVRGVSPVLRSSVSRRTFLAGAAACAAMSPALLRASLRQRDRRAVLHLATRTSQNGHVHTFALTPGDCEFLASTAVDSFAAFAVHPVLPVLYVARDCGQWGNLPRGVIETYAVECSTRPLRLLAETPMALSATGPRSLAVSSCGRHLLVSAFTGGAWNAFALDRHGMPASVAIARKETGTAAASQTMSLPTPHGLVFSPHEPLAVGTDPGSGRITLLQPSSEGIAALARCNAAHGLHPTNPAWTSDSRYVVAANARGASLSLYEVRLASANENNLHLLSTVQTATPVTAVLAHPTERTLLTTRPQGRDSRIELWRVRDSRLEAAGDIGSSGNAVALAHHSGDLWIASEDRLTRMPIRDLRADLREMRLPIRGIRAVIAQDVAVHPFNDL